MCLYIFIQNNYWKMKLLKVLKLFVKALVTNVNLKRIIFLFRGKNLVLKNLPFHKKKSFSVSTQALVSGGCQRCTFKSRSSWIKFVTIYKECKDNDYDRHWQKKMI